MDDPDYVDRYYRSGCSKRDPDAERTWEGDAPYWENYYQNYSDNAVLSIRRIAELCKEYEINLIVFTNPMYYTTYQESKLYGYDVFLEWLSDPVDYYNFSGINNQ